MATAWIAHGVSASSTRPSATIWPSLVTPRSVMTTQRASV
jgi:hypothetical protein